MKIVNISLFLLILITLAAGKVSAETFCFKCHAQKDFRNKVVHQPVSEGSCVDCHNPHVAKFKGLLQKKVSSLCYDCHDSVVTTETLSLVHKPVRQGECLACHDPHSSGAKGLLKEKRMDELCIGCHKDLAKNYAVQHAPYSKGKCSACHFPHESKQIQLLREEPEKLCRSCHKGSLEKGHKGFPAKPGLCLTCHNPHGSSRKGLIREILHAPFEDGCDDCHSEGKVMADKCLECHEDIMDKLQSAHSHLTSSSGNSCVNCHSPHASDSEKLFRNRQAQVCRSCHLDTFTNYIDKLYSHPDTGSCGDCHEVHGSVHLVMLRGDGNTVCSRCHESQGQFTHPVGEGVFDPRTGMILTCVTCHYPHGTNFKFNLKLSHSKELCVQCHRGYYR